MIAIFVVGSLPATPAVARDVSDKVQHAVGFALLAWLWCRALRALRPSSRASHVALGGLLVSVGVGGALELWQALLTYRSCEFLDWVADAVGALVAVGVYAGVHRLRSDASVE